MHTLLGKRKRDCVILGDHYLARECAGCLLSFRDQHLIFDVLRVLDFGSDTRHFFLELLFLIYGLTQLVKSLSELFLVHQFLQEGILLIVRLITLDNYALVLGVDLRIIGLILLTHLVEFLVILGPHLLDLVLMLFPELFDSIVHHFQLQVNLLLICNFWLLLLSSFWRR